MNAVQLTDAEQRAWDDAEKIDGHDPDVYRMDTTGDVNATIMRDKVNQRVKFGWIVDEQGRARNCKARFQKALVGAVRR